MPKHGTWMDMVCMLGVSWLSCDYRAACAFGTCLPCISRNLRSPNSRCGPGRVGRMDTIHENKSTQKKTKKNQKHKTSVQFLRTDSLILDSTLCLELADNCPFEDVWSLYQTVSCRSVSCVWFFHFKDSKEVEEGHWRWGTTVLPRLSYWGFVCPLFHGDGLVMGHEPCERHFPPQFVTPLALRPGCSFLLRGAGFPMELNGPMGLFNGHHWVFRVRVF